MRDERKKENPLAALASGMLNMIFGGLLVATVLFARENHELKGGSLVAAYAVSSVEDKSVQEAKAEMRGHR